MIQMLQMPCFFTLTSQLACVNSQSYLQPVPAHSFSLEKQCLLWPGKLVCSALKSSCPLLKALRFRAWRGLQLLPVVPYLPTVGAAGGSSGSGSDSGISFNLLLSTSFLKKVFFNLDINVKWKFLVTYLKLMEEIVFILKVCAGRVLFVYLQSTFSRAC